MKKLYLLFLPLLIFTLQNPADAQVKKWYYLDFSEDLGGWSEPDKSPNPPVIVENNGAYLQNESSGGGGVGSKWVMINTSSAWTGDYDEAGIENIFMDVRNTGANTIHLRLAFSNDNGVHFVNTHAIPVHPGTKWQTVHFSLDDDDLVVSEEGNMEDIMSAVNTVRLLSSPSPAWRGETIKATVEIDNIMMTGDIDYKTYLTGENQLPGTSTEARGTLYFEKENDSLIAWGQFQGISSGVDSTIGGGLHIHSGLAGQNGGVLFPLTATFDEGLSSGQLLPDQNKFMLTEMQDSLLEDHGMYVNVHSHDFSSGEIRGQILDADDELYRANLHGSNEMPAILTRAEGRIVLELDSNELTVSGSFKNLSSPLATDIAGGGHIHLGLPGSSGSVAIPLNIQSDSEGTSGTLAADDNEYDLTPDQMEAIRNRNFYVNIHSLNHPSGEIRGQIVSAASQKLFRAYLSGTNEVPMVLTTALGTVNIELLSPDSILVFGSYRGLGSPLNTAIAGGIHLHGGMAGENAGVLFPLENTSDSGTEGKLETRGYGLDSANLALLMNRSTYVNVHTEKFGSGEIRGQVLSDAPWHFTAPMTSSQELSSAVSTAHGALKGEWNGHQLTLSGVIQGLSSEIAQDIAGGGHIHMEMAGRNGGVVFPLHLDISENGLNARVQADSNIHVLADSLATALIRRGLYANIHTENHRSGEVRGQLLFDAAMYHAAVFGGSLENPPVNTPAKGLVLLEVNPGSMKMTGSVSGLTTPIDTSIAGGAHLHNAYAGQNGPVVMPVKIHPGDDQKSGRMPVMGNHYELTAPGLNVLRLRRGYLNIHTTGHPSGEIRGQVLPLSSYYLIANLDGQNEVPSIDATGSGTVVAEVNGNQATLSGSFSNLSAPLATNIAGGSHIHTAPAGQNGNVIVPLHSELEEDKLSGEFTADSNSIDTGEESILDRVWSGLYVNIHSENHPTGEIRGQLLPMINYFPDADSTSISSSDEITIDTTNMNTQVVIEWTPAVDEDPIIYQLEWAVDSTFDSIWYRSPYTMETQLAVADSNLLDTLMASGYFMDSDTACIMMRLRATDGSLSDVSDSKEICFILGVRTNRDDPLQSVVQISPVPASNEITISIRNYEAFRTQPDVKASIYNSFGQLIKQVDFRIFGPAQRKTIDIQSLPTGQYYLQLNTAVWPFVKL